MRTGCQMASAQASRSAELFVSDPHGEYDIFSRLLDSGCGGLCESIDAVHLVGDVFDRGPAPELIMDRLATLPKVDVQWGNHDVVWMGAALGQRGCIAHVVRNCARYGNMGILNAYGIDYAPLEEMARSVYADDPCVAFGLKVSDGLTHDEVRLNTQLQKAMAIIQFKVEGQLIDEYPSFDLADRKLLDKIDYELGNVLLDGVVYPLIDDVFPTVDPADPYRLTDEEESVMRALESAFRKNERLQAHMRFLLDFGSLYKKIGNTLLFHACVPLNPDGTLMEVDLFGRKYRGRALFDAVDAYIRQAFDAQDANVAKRGRDLLWYLWLGQGSPLFAKSKMATFEIYCIEDKAARKEIKNSFYALLEDEHAVAGIFEDFGMDPSSSRIICGHVPVKVKDGENPVKCGGKVIIIDGGMSVAYRKTTGLAGMALVRCGTTDTLALISADQEGAPVGMIRFQETREV